MGGSHESRLRAITAGNEKVNPISQSSSMGEPYARRLDGALRFSDLTSAESCIRNLDEAYRTYIQASDRLGVSLVRSLLLKGKQRAQAMARNPRVNPSKRKEKAEVARWFTVWLQTPDLFFDWLEVRKGSEEFRELFG